MIEHRPFSSNSSEHQGQQYYWQELYLQATSLTGTSKLYSSPAWECVGYQQGREGVAFCEKA